MYASHKFTQDEGGAQDNQYKDVQEFLINARDLYEEKTILIAICDGAFYKKIDTKIQGGYTRIERLRKINPNASSVYVCTLDDSDNHIDFVLQELGRFGS